MLIIVIAKEELDRVKCPSFFEMNLSCVRKPSEGFKERCVGDIQSTFLEVF
jgi:hypothetical protein